MKMALPRGMFRHHKTGMLWARKDVPRELRTIIGQTSLQRTLKTKELEQARAGFHSIMAGFEARIAQARKIAAGDREASHEPYSVALTPDVLRWAQTQPQFVIQQFKRDMQQAKLINPPRELLSLDQLFEKWKAERKPSQNTAEEFLRALNQFRGNNGEHPITEYTAQHARAFKDAILAGRKPDGSQHAFQTQQKKFVGVKTIFAYADKNELLDQNPFAKVTLDRPKRAIETARQEWDHDQLRALFGSPVYASHKRPRGGAREASYWLPVLSLFHGARLGELCQLSLSDVVTKNGILSLSISPSWDDEHGQDKSTKTVASVRLVPLHRECIRLGFSEYVNGLRKQGKAKLFPAIKPDTKGRISGLWSKWFGRYRTEIGITTRYPDFHSFRHNWKSAARSADLPEDFHDQISGHDNKSVGRGYGKYPVERLKQSVDLIEYPVVIPVWPSR
jgi:integrase